MDIERHRHMDGRRETQTDGWTERERETDRQMVGQLNRQIGDREIDTLSMEPSLKRKVQYC
jgi:hypothetical protein